MTSPGYDLAPARFHTVADVRHDLIRTATAAGGAVRRLGESEEGRPIDAFLFGRGERTVGLMAGAHADEPVGPETLRRLIRALAGGYIPSWWLDTFRFVIVPHVNPDGEARNRPWIRRWPDVGAFIRLVDRELPGRDVEFGFPEMRVENRLLSDLWHEFASFDLHMSLHGMAFAEGAMLLIDRHWADRVGPLRDAFVSAVRAEGLPLHDHDRQGEKGFLYYGPGFTSTPLGSAMRTYFLEQNDPEMAERFHSSSMEAVRSIGGDPLCLVTELPLFLVAPDPASPPGRPAAYLRWKQELPELKLRLVRGEDVTSELNAYGVRPLPLEAALRVHRATIGAALDTIRPPEGQANSQRTM